MRILSCLIWHLTVLVVASSAWAQADAPPQKAQAIVVRPAAWASALTAWKLHRAEQGIEIVEVDSELGQNEIKKTIVSAYQTATDHSGASQLKFVLLCGDVGPESEDGIATYYRESRALVQFGGDKNLATDNPYADIDGDELPDLALGRIPADNIDQLQAAMQRIVWYETQADNSMWRRNVHVVAGVGGFGAVADSVIEMTTRKFLGDRIPGWARVTMTQASTGSHYCPDPVVFSDAVIGKLNEGGMFWVYIGHGHVETLDQMRVERDFYPIMDVRNLSQVNVPTTPPIAIFLACYTGAMDASRDSLAERMVLSKNGPIAAVAASRVSGPYGLAMLSNGMLSGFYERRMNTLGEIVTFAKREAMKELTQSADTDPSLKMIDAIAQALSPKDYDLRAERQEHVWQVQLIGDPMLRISHVIQMPIEVTKTVQPGGVVEVRGQASLDGSLTIELTHRRTDKRRELDKIGVDWRTEAGRAAYVQRYSAANDGVIKKVQRNVRGGDSFAIPLEVPADLGRGRYSVRAFVESAESWQAGYAETAVRPARAR
ncbi:MAG: C25 family cysteine peptidase [Aureliella sp.]